MYELETKGTDIGRQDANGESSSGMIEVASTRAAQEVQAAMVIAKKFPRDESRAFQRIMQACKRKALADAAVYEYPKGKGEDGKANFVTGPSIRLAEVLAQNWGNMDFGIIELEQRLGESTVMAYAWDLETNTRYPKIFTVRHVRHTKRGQYALTDPRDIYELTANQGARRLRACILGLIPGDVVDAAVAECEKTMEGKNEEPLADRVRKMLTAFTDLSVTQEMIEASLKHKADSITEKEVSRLRKIFRSLKDNIASVADFFDVPGGDQPESELGKKMKMVQNPSATGATQPSQIPAAPPMAVTPETTTPLTPDPTPPTPGMPRNKDFWEDIKSAWLTLAASKGINLTVAAEALKKAVIAADMRGRENQIPEVMTSRWFAALEHDAFDLETGRVNQVEMALATNAETAGV